jgi:hypothetical protein
MGKAKASLTFRRAGSTYGLLAILRMARLQSQVDAFHIDGQALFMF